MGDPVFDLGDTDNRSTELTGQAVSGCSITTDISWGLFKTDFWESGLSSGPVDADERDLPQTRWWFSQSLCWQNEPQYLAMLQPLHVSLAFLPQFQQLCNDIMKSTINTVNQIVNQISTPIRGLNYTLKYTINTVNQISTPVRGLNHTLKSTINTVNQISTPIRGQGGIPKLFYYGNHIY